MAGFRGRDANAARGLSRTRALSARQSRSNESGGASTRDRTGMDRSGSGGFSYLLRLSPPRAASAVHVRGLERAFTIACALGARRPLSTPSAPARLRLGSALPRGARCTAGDSPNLTGFISRVSARALKLISSPLRLPISPSRPARMVAPRRRPETKTPRSSEAMKKHWKVDQGLEARGGVEPPWTDLQSAA